MSELGQTLLMDSAPVPPDVRCCSKSDHLRRECEMMLRPKPDSFTAADSALFLHFVGAGRQPARRAFHR
jgi:hypothetical protein